MKKIALIACIFLLGITTSCEKEDEVEGVEVRMTNSGLKADSYEVAWEENAYYSPGSYHNEYYSDGRANLGITSGNNFWVGLNSYYTTLGQIEADVSITSIGSVRSLGKIKSVPKSGWTQQVSVKPGNGYVVKFEGKSIDGRFCHYARIYVVEWIENTSGGINGAIVRYEGNWQPVE